VKGEQHDSSLGKGDAMSRSYRKPYSSMCGGGSAKQDKMIAARGVRRVQNRSIRECRDWDEYVVPHRYECPHNNVWCWGRDGKQRLQTMDHNYFNPYWLMSPWDSFWTEEKKVEWSNERCQHHLNWIEELKRK
jgi:hypothetical protein